MKKEIGYKINLGLGSILLMKYLLDQVKHDFDKIYITPNKSLIRDFRNDRKEYYDFIDELLILLFGEAPYILSDRSDPLADYGEIRRDFKSYNVSLSGFNLKKYFVTEEFSEKEKYIVLSTKVRDVLYTSYENYFSSDFYNLLNHLSSKYKIFLIGEKRIDPNEEYRIHKDYVFCIYTDIIKNVPNVIDLTVDEIANNPVISLLKRDCSIMNNCYFSVCLGDGGNFCLSSSVSPKTFSLITYPKFLDETLIDLNKNHHIKLCTSFSSFEEKIKNFIK